MFTKKELLYMCFSRICLGFNQLNNFFLEPSHPSTGSILEIYKILKSSKFLLFQTPNAFFCMHKIHIISSEMKKVTLKNLIRDFIFLTAAQTLCTGRHSLHFPQKHQSRFPLHPLVLFQLLCLHS